MPVTEPLPSDLPEWDPANPARIEDPGAPKKAAGWDDGEAPPAKWFNWQWNLVYQWLRYIKDVLANSYGVEHNTTSGTHSDVTADTVDISDTLTVGNANQFSVNDSGNVDTSGTIVADTSVSAPDYLFPAIEARHEIHLINQDNVLSSSGPAAISARTFGAASHQTMEFGTTGEIGYLPFIIETQNDVPTVVVYGKMAALTNYAFDVEIVSLGADGDWNGEVAGIATQSGTSDADGLWSETITIPDTDSPLSGSSGWHSDTTKIAAIKITENGAAAGFGVWKYLIVKQTNRVNRVLNLTE